jgi:hypothetical protein
VVGVEFCDQSPALNMRREGVNGWRHHATRAAPVGVEINGDRHVALRDRPLKSVIVESERTLQENRTTAFSAFRTVDDFTRVDPVPSLAKLAAHGELPARRIRFYFHPRLSTR